MTVLCALLYMTVLCSILSIPVHCVTFHEVKIFAVAEDHNLSFLVTMTNLSEIFL